MKCFFHFLHQKHRSLAVAMVRSHTHSLLRGFLFLVVVLHITEVLLVKEGFINLRTLDFSMDVRSIKKEVESLSNVADHTAKIQRDFLRPLQENFLPHLPFETRTLVNRHLHLLKKELADAKTAQSIHERLLLLSRSLVEMKLTVFNGDAKRRALLKNQLLRDEVLSIPHTVEDIKVFEAQASRMQQHYSEIIQMVGKDLTLENNVLLHHLVLRNGFQALSRVAQQQKELVYHLGKEFTLVAKA